MPMIVGFERGQPLVGVHVVERAEQLFLGVHVARRAVAADADAERAGRAALALRVPDRVQDALAHALERAIGATQVRQLGGQRVLAFMFSQPPPLRISLTSISSRSHCSKWMIGVPGPRLLPEFSPVSESTEFGRSLPRLVASATASRICFFEHDLVDADRRLHLEGGHAGVLADGALAPRPPGRCSGR